MIENDLHDYINHILVDDKSDNVSDDNTTLGAKVATNRNNVVSAETLRKVQSKTLNETKDFLARTFGPMGSNTKIIRGENQQNITSSYSKDGLHVLKNIINSGPIEASIVEELETITRAVEKEVGDGTTSTVILSAIIFDKLTVLQKKYSIPPFRMSKLFKEVVDEIKENILEDGRECTLDDIYNISMISTNGNEEVSTNIKNIYEQYGMDVDLSVGISNGVDSVLRSYDGLTITEGYSDPAFINNPIDNVCEIRDAHIYHFADPIDTPEMVALFEAILIHNIYDPLTESDDEEYRENPVIPTVITCPRLSRDMSSIMKKLVEFLYQYGRENAGAKPPLLIITNVVASDEVIMDDIANLSDCKTIRKYIDFKLQQKDIEAGIAPTAENVWEFAGHAEVVVADNKKTKFINPACMKEDNPRYIALMNFLKNEIESAENTENANEVGKLKKRLNALNANMVDYLVGGVTVAERDMYKDLVEDAVKNCKSAALYGVGYAANFEGLINSYRTFRFYRTINCFTKDFEVKLEIAECLFESYVEISAVLYGTVEYDKERVAKYIAKSIELDAPYNIANGYLPENIEDVATDVLCSIKLDVQILDLVTKIINLMNSCNQCLLQASNLNVYELE